jgi:O-antigen ligase/polysaccharide polymerase Wzy-like membrane protein
MTARVPMTAQPLGLASSSSGGIGSALDRIAYIVLCAFVFDLPWGEYVPQLGGLVLGTWIGLLAVGVMALRTAVTWRRRILSPLHYWMLSLVAWSALSIFWTLDWDSTVTRVGTYVQVLTMVWVIWELAVTEGRIVGLLQAYVFGALVASTGTMYNFMAGRTAAQLALTIPGRVVWETYRYSFAFLNEDDLGLVLALSIPMVFYLLASRKGSLVKLLCWLQLVAGVAAILLTGSRGALVEAIAGLAMFPLIVFRLPQWQRVASLVACFGLIACGTYFIPQSSWIRIFQFGSELSHGTLTHRTVIWAAGLGAFRDNALLGVGAGAYGPTILRVVDVPYVAHNTFISVLVELGVVGALLLSALLASFFYCAKRMRYLERCLWITLLLTWTVGVSSLTWEYRKPTWFLFGLLAAHVYSRRQENRPPALSSPFSQPL